MNAPATDVAVRDAAPIDRLKVQVASRADEFKMVLPSHIGLDKFQRTVATAAMSNPKLLDCDRRSLLLACLKLAQDGLLPDGREAALVPFKNRAKVDGQWVDEWQVQPMPMVYGLRKKILQSGQVVSLEVGVVYAAEVQSGNFIHEIGMDPPIRHRPKLDLTEEEADDANIVAAYSIAKIKNDAGGDPYWSVEVMPRREINKIRQMSQTGAVGRTVQFGKDKGKPIEPKGPWVDWFAEMAKKSALRRHSKVLPMSGDILETIDRDREEELRAEGAARLLAEHPEEVARLPSNDELDERVDEETGEVTTDARGMTEVDEETARALDAGEDSVEQDEPEQADDPPAEAATPTAKGKAEPKPESELDKRLMVFRERIEAAENTADVKRIDDDWVKERAAYDDGTAAGIDRLISEKRNAVKGEG